MTEFNTEKAKKKSEINKYIAIALIIYGLIKLFRFDWPHQFTTSTTLGLTQGILLPLIGFIILWSSIKKIKQIDGDFIKFKEGLLHIKSRGIERKIENTNEIKSIAIHLDDIMITYTDGLALKIHLVDYTDTSSRKEIKQSFKDLYGDLVR